MAENVLISILIPVYNAERYLERCLDSVLAQTYGSFEIVAIDDGSSDGSPAILDAYAQREPKRVRVEHRANAGAAEARNRAIELARGEYVAFLDNDDWLDPDFLEQLASHVGEGADIVFGGYRRPHADGSVASEIVPHPGEEWAPFAVLAAWAKLYRREFLLANDLRFLSANVYEDLYFSIPAIYAAQRTEVVPYCGYNWFMNPESVSNTSQRTSEGLEFDRAMSALVDRVGVDASGRQDALFVHAMVRLGVFSLFLTRDGDGPELAAERTVLLRAWLDAHVPTWRSDPYARMGRPRGDSRGARIATWLFVRHPRLFAAALRLK